MRSLVSGLVLVLAASRGGVARAEADSFGIGDGHSGAKTVAGDEVVNAYAAVAADVPLGANQIAFGTVVGDTTNGFKANDLVLIWRATGVASTEAGVASGNQNTLTLATVEGGDVGRWELARVSAVVGSTMTLTKPTLNAWKKNVTQVVRVPEYTTLSIPGGTSIKAAPWQASGTGFAGGIVAVYANDTITNDGKIDANADGFRGGQKVNRTTAVLDCPNSDGMVQQGYAPKGESIVATVDGSGTYAQLYGADIGGRGNRSIGAGGGNCVENGGAGGGNFGKGGTGGESFLGGISGTNRAGLGGAALLYSLADANEKDPFKYSRITLGGGGGAGEQKNSLGSSGGIGGGAVFLRAKSLAGAGTIEANGEDAANAQLLGVESDGAGGGGAGGSVLVRVVDDATCGGISVKGGKGGDSQVFTASVWGPGGGGAGGRAFVQADTGTCPITATAGAAGQSGGASRNATAGIDGDGKTTPTDPASGLCTTNAVPAQCANPSPACDVERGFCTTCNGGFGTKSEFPCEDPTKPVCVTSGPNTGQCSPCQRDSNVAGDGACQQTATPWCDTGTGECGKCTNDGDCVGPTHAGTKCNPQAGACGKPCNGDADCNNTEWCAQGVCIPKTPNSQPVSNLPPDTNGMCTPPVGKRTCLSGVCEEDDDLCGLHNGDPCEGKNEECRSSICFPKDELCGLPNGEPCTTNDQCRSEECKNGICIGCNVDTDCPSDKICDSSTHQCVTGCRPGEQAPDAGADSGLARGLCPPGTECKAPDGGPIGSCVPTNDAGAGDGGAGGDGGGPPFQAGIVEGGGCSCRTGMASSASPFALFAAAIASLLAARRRRGSR